MKRLTGMLLGLCVSACSVNHEIKIPKEPCFYPFKNYDFTLCTDFTFSVNGNNRTIPQGFTTDWATIPRIFWTFYSPSKAETIPAAVIHDFLYFCPQTMTRREADSIFYDALVFQGFPKRTAFNYWIAVRVFGSPHFNKGAICNHVHARTENPISHMRMAYYATSASG